MQFQFHLGNSRIDKSLKVRQTSYDNHCRNNKEETMKNILLPILVVFLAVATGGGCASKINRVYVGQCAMPGHSFCGQRYDKYSDCNIARKRHDYETSMTGSCHSGREDGLPDYRSM
jgi:hypothetical protein